MKRILTAALLCWSSLGFSSAELTRAHRCDVVECSSDRNCSQQVAINVYSDTGTGKVTFIYDTGRKTSAGETPFKYIATSADLPISTVYDPLVISFEIGDADKDQLTAGRLWIGTMDYLDLTCQTSMP